MASKHTGSQPAPELSRRRTNQPDLVSLDAFTSMRPTAWRAATRTKCCWVEEFRRAATEVVFLNSPIGGTAEDDLLLQVQGVIAEYERAKILERSRRGRRQAARSGSLSAFTTAPYGFRYVPRAQGGGVARFEVTEEEEHVVRQVFVWVALDRLCLREVFCRMSWVGC